MSMTEHLNKLVEQRNRAWNEQKSILDEVAKRDDPSLSAEEREKVERIDADLDALDAEIRQWTEREQREREAAIAREAYAPLLEAGQRSEPQGPSGRQLLLDAIEGRSVLEVDFTAIAAEKRAIRAGADPKELRDLTVGSAGGGGNTVPTSFIRQLYDYLEVFSGMRRTNATIITTAGGENLEIPKVTSHGTAAIVGEGTALAEADPAFGKTTLGSWKYGQLLQISRELLEDSGVDIEGFVARDMGRAIARVTDNAYVLGGGTNAPTGVMAACGTGDTGGGGTGATGVTFDDLIDLLYSVNEEYRMNGAHWLMRDATAGSVRKIKDNDGQYLWQPSTQVGQPDRLLGHPVVTDPNVAALGTSAKSIAFGDFSAYWIRDVGSIRVERSTDYAFANDLVTYKGTLRTDGDLVDLTGAIKAFVGGTA